MKRSRNYDPELDKKAKIGELKALYYKMHNSDFSEKTLAEDIYDQDDASIISQEVKAFFERRTPRGTPGVSPHGTPRVGNTPPSSVSGGHSSESTKKEEQ